MSAVEAAEPRTVFGWWDNADRDARRALAAGMFAWMLDAFDVMLFALVLPAVSADLGPDEGAGRAARIGDAHRGRRRRRRFGRIADRFGRTRALMISVALYSVFTFLVRLRQTLGALRRPAHFSRLRHGRRVVQRRRAGVRIVAIVQPRPGARLHAERLGHRLRRRRARGGFVQPRYGWRAVFFIGILPALFALWIQRRVKEPAIWTASRGMTAVAGRFGGIFSSGIGSRSPSCSP